ncbi:hypothetical protein [Chryseobacterium geocarposphaerae]|nr:hypothetical protein [Chryseobacterium geocarposphaerae]
MQQNLYNEQRKLFAAPDIEHCQDWCQKYILHEQYIEDGTAKTCI